MLKKPDDLAMQMILMEIVNEKFFVKFISILIPQTALHGKRYRKGSTAGVFSQKSLPIIWCVCYPYSSHYCLLLYYILSHRIYLLNQKTHVRGGVVTVQPRTLHLLQSP